MAAVSSASSRLSHLLVQRCPGQPPVPTTDNPDFHRSDIDIRREQYREYRAAKAKTTSGSGSLDSPIDIDDAGSRDASASMEDEDDEDQEDILCVENILLTTTYTLTWRATVAISTMSRA